MNLKDALDNLPLIAILRGIAPGEATDVGHALEEAGWHAIEVPLNSPQPMQSIGELSKAFPKLVIGAGTVLTVQQVQEVHAAGGRLVVAPNFNAEVVRAAVSLGMECVPGVMTPTEAFAALDAGATAVKLFPAEMIPPAAVKAMRAVLPPAALLLPVGGISTSNMGDYLAAGANGFGIGSALYKPGKSADAVKQSALDFKAALLGAVRA
jgi:2-dehydro-3-deoxyphosphogalactonate aldolase